MKAPFRRGGVEQRLLVRMRVDLERACEEGDFEHQSQSPCREVGHCRARFRVDEGDEEQTVDKEGANEVNLLGVSQPGGPTQTCIESCWELGVR